MAEGLIETAFDRPERPVQKCEQRGCNGQYDLSRYCGAYVCDVCDDHKGLARCYCGWSAGGGDGYRELIEMGETIEEDY